MEKTVSVVIPVYNCENYIEETVMAIAKQPIQVKEIIIVDDGSTDRSGQICDLLSRSIDNIIVIHQKNSGVSVARNQGLKKALGDYIVFCDADDVWEDGFFDDTIIEQLSDNYDIVGYQHYEADEGLNNKKLIDNNGNKILSGGVDAIWAHGKRHLGCLFFKNRFLKEKRIKFLPNLKYNEDEIFKVESECLCNKMAFYTRPMYIYRLNSASAVHNLDEDIIGRYQTWMLAWRKMDEWLIENHDIKSNFGSKFAEIYFVEMCIVYTEALKPLFELNDLIVKHQAENASVLLSEREYPSYLQKEVYLLKNHKKIFFIKHRIVGGLRYVKRSFCIRRK